MSVKIGGKELKPQAQKVETAKAEKAKPQAKKRNPTKRGYPARTFTRLIQYIADGECLTDACKHQGMPVPSTVRRRMAVDEVLAEQIERADKIRLHSLVERMPYYADEALEGQQKVSTADRLTAAKIKSDNVKWLAQRLLNEYAGDGEGGNVVLHITGAADIPPVSQPGSSAPVPASVQPHLKIINGTKPAEGSEDGSAGNA